MKHILLLALLVVAAAADGGDIQIDSSHTEDNSERNTQIQIQSSQVQIESSSQNGNFHDKFSLEFQTPSSIGNGGNTQLGMTQQSNNNGTQSQFKFRVRFFGVTEYVESDGVAGYSSAAEACGNPYVLGGAASALMQITSLPTTYYFDSVSNTNITIRNFQAQTQDQFFTIIFHISGGQSGEKNGKFVMNGRAVPPTAMKFDIVLDPTAANYQWKCNSTTSRLALVAKAKSAARIGSDSTQRNVQFGSSATPMGFFTWASTVAVPNANSAVNVIFGGFAPQSTSDSDADSDLGSGEESYRAVYSFDFPRPSKITWDPELGYLQSTTTTTPSSAAAVGVSFAILAILALLQIFAF